jgi:hypothetical protein
MITNANLTRIDAPPTVAMDNSRTWVEGDSIAVRVAVDQPTTGQKWIVGAEIKEATAVMYVEKRGGQDSLNSGILSPSSGGRAVLMLDGDTVATMYQVLSVINRRKGSVSHDEVYLKQL